MAPVRIALVGCGVVSGILVERTYPALGELASVVATVDVRAERAAAAAQALGARPFTRLADALAAGGVDGVDIRLPHGLHAPAALQAVAAGCHVLVEKPLATGIEEGASMVAAAQQAGVVLCVAENYRFLPALHEMRQLIDQGAIGTPLVVRTQRICSIDGVWNRDGWRTEGTGRQSSVLLDQGCHQAHMLRVLAGEIAAVQAVTSRRHPAWRGEDSAVMLCRFASGLAGQVALCWGSPTSVVGAEAYVYGTEGSLELHVGYGEALGALMHHHPGRSSHVDPSGASYEATFVPTVEDWLLACAGERTPGMPGIEGLRDLAVVEAAHRSAQSRREEAVDDAAALVARARCAGLAGRSA